MMSSMIGLTVELLLGSILFVYLSLDLSEQSPLLCVSADLILRGFQISRRSDRHNYITQVDVRIGVRVGAVSGRSRTGSESTGYPHTVDMAPAQKAGCSGLRFRPNFRGACCPNTS